MASANECRQFADEILGWVKTAKSEREREIFRQMADTWLYVAARLEDRLESAPRDAKSLYLAQ